MANIKIIKLISSEEVIAEIQPNGEDKITIKDAALIVYQKREDGMGCGLAPYMPFSTGNIDLMNHAIAAITDPSDQLINEYNRIFGSGIVLASANDAALKTK